MPSPFPGVDPFLESQSLWLEFHSKFVNCWQELLLERLPPQYDARLDERIYLADLSEEEARLIRPDVAVERQTGDRGRSIDTGTSTVVLEPVTVRLLMEEEVREPYIRILHRENLELVCVLEVLSPTNKISPGVAEYRQKRAAILRQSIHLVELDLLLVGGRLPTLDPLPAGHYFVLVSRAQLRPNSDVYAWTVRDPLPSIPIPLKAPDPDYLCDLGEVFRLAFQRGHYERAIDYSQTEDLRFEESDLAWIAQRVGKPPPGGGG
jgi:hypothetical protein